MTLRVGRAFVGGEAGATASEFALILPGMMFLLLGTINLFMVIYAEANLHSATEAVARYASVQTASTGTTPTAAALNTYGLTKYVGPRISAAFAYPGTGNNCGNANGYRVTGTGTYRLYYGFGTKSISLAANACFP